MLPKIPKGIMSPEGERYIGVLLENIEGTLKLIFEKLDFSDKRTDNLETRVDHTEIRLDDIELRLMDEE
ncbi:MAG: hypothetical protein ABR884_03685 [Minisyncoccia bacterium]